MSEFMTVVLWYDQKKIYYPHRWGNSETGAEDSFLGRGPETEKVNASAQVFYKGQVQLVQNLKEAPTKHGIWKR